MPHGTEQNPLNYDLCMISVRDEGSIHQGIATTTVGRLITFHNECLISENKNKDKVSQNSLISAQ